MIWPPFKRRVQKHSQLLPTTVRTQYPWSLPTWVLFCASKTLFANTSRSPTESPLVPRSTVVSPTGRSTTLICSAAAATFAASAAASAALPATLKILMRCPLLFTRVLFAFPCDNTKMRENFPSW